MKLFLFLAIILIIGNVSSKPVIPFSYPLYKQCDSRWGNDLIITETICDVGCLMSSCSMAIGGKGITIDDGISNPGSLNTWLKSNSGYEGDNLLVESSLENVSNKINYVGSFPSSQYTMDDIISMLNKKDLILIINVNQGSHFVLATGYDTTESDYVYVNDPGFTKSYYTYQDIVGYRIFKM
ncbi:hypothetical protein DDB_G0267756 [Dictyostelium discoideum AX4]|uniref:Peptidase C39-like domain-containing protein n=1 Tax=Dictyostelium discoideum TaxID=44689 RepID=Q55G99_DICDI|nr:hypothetical protein DDB_G0267756 [Dictyostelium discoideum AX4]EAL73331.1 hypothetical protein DDB_G0267756 [Dictyostelium discoideum AX4]|eukprot:XP_647285.1 hypothetical protein DDB_G0267756 [Dictyostelium discoideum AX4]